MEFAHPRLLTLLSLVVLAASAGALRYARSSRASAPRPPVPGEGPTLAVEVLNGTEVDGLAREIARRLRSDGIDVVYFGSIDRRLDSTVIVVRRGDTSAALPIRAALGLGQVLDDGRVAPRRLLGAGKSV